MREKAIEHKLVKAVKAEGGMCPKLVSPGTDGMPDRMVLLPEAHIGFVEVKAPGEKPRPLQVRRHEQLRELGFQVSVLYDPEQIPARMADVITLKNGRNEIVFDERSFLDLVDEHMGSEARRWLEEWLGENDDASDYIDDLEKELAGAKDHHKAVMAQLRQQSETIAGLIREKEIDRKALSTAAGQIGCITWRELNV